ncbi:MAG: MATE family efflux transporter [Ruthenibacterium sp.]
MQKLQNPPRFTRSMLLKLLVPLIIEQLLAVTVGMADTMMVARVGEAAVSGISLVDQINILLIQVFAALATGGAVVASQYLGRNDGKNARIAAKQLIYSTLALACILAVLVLFCNKYLLALVFGHVEPAVMQAAETYFWLSAVSYPFLALYNAGASLFRSMGNSKISLYASFWMNIINIVGNAILIFGFGLGVAGAAIATLVSRAFAGIFMIVLLHNQSNPIYLERIWHPVFHKKMLMNILRVGVPSGIENGMFQFGKLLVAGLIASFGTTALAANAVCNGLGSLSNMPGAAIGLGMITVIGQCVGGRDFEQARYYARKLTVASYVTMGVINLIVFFAAPFLIGIYHMSAETAELSLVVLRFFCVMCMTVWPISFVTPNVLRAAGDAKFTMITSMISMWLCRVVMAYVLGAWLGMGLLGVWIAMTMDWVVRGAVFVWRYRSGKWQEQNLIDR